MAIFALLIASAAVGDGQVVRMPRGWTTELDPSEEEAGSQVSVSVLPASMRAMVSRDNFIEVYTDEVNPADGVGFKSPIFKSAVDAVERIASLTSLEMPRGGAGLVIHVGASTNNDPSVVKRVERNRSGAVITRLYLPSPAFSDLDAFSREIAAAYLRAWTSRTADAASGNARTPYAEAPEWVAHGLSRAADDAFSLFDRLDAFALWQKAELPFFPNLPSVLKFDTDRGSSLCGFMVKWMLEQKTQQPGAGGKPVAQTAFVTMMNGLAKNKKWNNADVVELLSGEKDPQAQDAAFDAHMLKYRQTVLVPGQSTPEDVRTFASRLLLYPPFFDISFSDGRKACPLRLAIRNASDPHVRVAAFVKQRGLALTVIGRGELLVKASESYIRFLKALAAGEDKDSLVEKLDEAEALLGAAYKESEEMFGI